MRPVILVLLAVGAGSPVFVSAQVPLPFQSGLESASKLPPAVRQSIESITSQYPFEGFRAFGNDSALFVFADSSMTIKAVRSGTWMFGPPVTAAEADSCPPDKVLGRKVARIYWRGVGRPLEMKQVLVAVHGTIGGDRGTIKTMYFSHDQLERPWVGDSGVLWRGRDH